MKAGLTVLLAVASASVNTHVKVETVNFDEGLLNTVQNIAETFAWKEKKTGAQQGEKMLMDEFGVSREEAKEVLKEANGDYHEARAILVNINFIVEEMKSKNQSWSTKELTAFVGYLQDVTKTAQDLKGNDKDRILEHLCKKFTEDASLIDVKLSGLQGCPIQGGERGRTFVDCNVDLTVTSPGITAISTSGGLAPVKVHLEISEGWALTYATIEDNKLENKDAVRIYNELKENKDECMLKISKTMQKKIVEKSKKNSGATN